MMLALDNEESPLDANLESVLPGVQQWHRVNDELIKLMGRQLHEKMDGLQAEVRNGIQSIVQQHSVGQLESDKRLAASFLQVARCLIGQSGKE